MSASQWLRLVAMAVLAVIGEARADSRAVTTLAPELPLPGTGFDEARALPLGPDRRLVCDSDADKPRLAQPQLLEFQAGRDPGRVRRCAVVAPGADGVTWASGTIPTLGGPARLWMVFVEQGSDGRFRLAQLRLSLPGDSWDKVAGAVAQALGPGAAVRSRYISWQDSQHETLMFVDDKHPAEFKLVVDDVRLRRLLRSPGGR